MVRLKAGVGMLNLKTELGWGPYDEYVVRLWVGRVWTFLYLCVYWGGGGKEMDGEDICHGLQSTMA